MEEKRSLKPQFEYPTACFIKKEPREVRLMASTVSRQSLEHQDLQFYAEKTT